MGMLNLKAKTKKRAAAFKPKNLNIFEDPKKEIQGTEPIEKKLIKKGYARKGDRVATVKPAFPGRNGKNILGETIDVEPVYIPRLVAGKNIREDGGLFYYMTTDGVVELFEDDIGILHIRGRVYQFGRFTVAVSFDRMKAYLTVVPSLGGAPAVRLEDVLSNCSKLGIVFGIRKDKIIQAIEKAEKERQEVKNFLFAEGEEPIHGDDGRIEYKIRIASGDKFTQLEGGKVDYREQDLITRVEEGQLVAVVYKAREGVKNGSTVKGNIIKAERGQDIEVNTGNNIRLEDHGDNIHFYSKRDGLLQNEKNVLSVSPLMVVPEDVGPKTGNINFNGVVIIKGNVQDNFRVYAKKNITIMGSVGSAVVRSDENITVLNGVMAKLKGLIYAKGDVKVKFAENSNLQAGGNIYIRRAALNCTLTAGDKIIAKLDKGQLIGGKIKATRGIEVKILGNELEQKMEVFVGSDFFLENRIKELRLSVQKYEASLKKILLLIEKIKQVGTDPDELPDKLKKVYTDALKKKTLYKFAIKDLQKKESEFVVNVNKTVDGEIIAYESLFPGVKIYIGKSFFETEKMKTRVKVYFDKVYDNIMLGNI
jgi:uncharacterized protein (DUF342 family)